MSYSIKILTLLSALHVFNNTCLVLPGQVIIITKLNTIAIVNTTNESLSSKGVLSERIHRAAGPELLHECRSQLLGMNIVSEIKKWYYSIVKSRFLESSFPKTP